ncbi:hypothetical protein [Gorillibacterium sp. CAU 1737]
MSKKKSLKQSMQSMEDRSNNAEGTKDNPATNINNKKFHQPNRPSV